MSMQKQEIKSPIVVGGSGANSYFKNSYYQKLTAGVVKESVDEEIRQKLDFNDLEITSKTFRLADFGCAVGPNTFYHVVNLIEAIKQKHFSQSGAYEKLEFQVFFNDQVSNDFNTLFASLPQDGLYFAAGVPGSFHGRLFPNSSLHFGNCSIALHWLSEVPPPLLYCNSGAWNRGRVHYTCAPDKVLNAYRSQFAKDMECFLRARGEEIVSNGMLVIITGCIPDGMSYSEIGNSLMFECLALSLMDMVKQGLIEEAQVDSFNLPFYNPSPGEMRGIIERNGNFKIERMEMRHPAPWLNGPVNIPEWVQHIRSATEGIFVEHFGSQNIEQIFDGTTEKLSERSELLESKVRDNTLLLVILKRK